MKKINPFFLFDVVLIIDILLYSLKLSCLYPNLTVSLVFFLIFIVVLFLILGLFLSRYINDNFKNNFFTNTIFPLKHEKYATLFSIFGTILEGIYSKGFPLFNYSKNNSYGIPQFHVFLTVYIAFITITIFYDFEVENNKKRFKSSIKLIILNFLCLILTLSRAILAILILDMLWIYLLRNHNGKKVKILNKIFIGIFIIISLYLFGILGNYRSRLVDSNNAIQSNNLIDSSYIFQIGEAKEQVVNHPKLGPFYWDYLYLSSPLSNFQNIVNERKSNNINENYIYILTQYIPQNFSKWLFPDYVSSNSNIYLISDALNVSTVFYQSFYILGWLGVIFMLIYISIFPFIYLFLIKVFIPKYFCIALSFLSTTYVLNLFDNMFSFSVTSLLLIFPFFVEFIRIFFKKTF